LTEEPEDNSVFRQLFTVGVIGIQFALSIFAGFAMGYFLDKWLNTFPWLTVIFLILGIVAAFRELFRLARRQNESNKKSD
jgi:ATP synthase protein I